MIVLLPFAVTARKYGDRSSPYIILHVGRFVDRSSTYISPIQNWASEADPHGMLGGPGYALFEYPMAQPSPVDVWFKKNLPLIC